MMNTIVLTIVFIAIALSNVWCDTCPEPTDSSLKCTKVMDLMDEANYFKEWALKKCPDENTEMDDAEIEKMKGCATTHVEPCIISIEFMHTMHKHMMGMDMKHICKKSVQEEMEKYIMGEIEKHSAELEKEGDANCSKIKNAMHEVKKCGGL